MVTIDHAIEGKVFLDAFAAGPTMLVRQRTILKVGNDRLSQSRRIPSRYQAAGNALFDQFRISADTGGHDWNRAGHCFENRVGNPLCTRRQDKAVKAAHYFGYVGALAREPRQFTHTAFVQYAHGFGAQHAFASDDQFELNFEWQIDTPFPSERSDCERQDARSSD